MDAYTHGCILHPELTVDSMIPAYATTRIPSQIGKTESKLKKLAEENPDLQEAYIAKQKWLKSKLLDHDNVKYLKKIIDELEKVLDQVETELRRSEETQEGGHQPWLWRQPGRCLSGCHIASVDVPGVCKEKLGKWKETELVTLL